MNYPGNPSGNWTWRMVEKDLSRRLLNRLKETNYLYARLAAGYAESAVDDEEKEANETIQPKD